jgi:hypothetical protein
MSGINGFVDFVRRYVLFVGTSFGLVLLAGGVLAQPTSDLGTVLVGLGGSIVAASVLALISLSREDLLEALFRQGVIEVFSSRIGRCRDSYWRDLLSSTSREYRVLGVANHGYIGQAAKEERYTRLFTEAVARGVQVEFLWLSPNTATAQRREIEEGRKTRSDTVKSILFFWELRNSLPEPHRERLSLKLHEHLPSCGLTRSDDRLTVTHYIAGQDNQDAPGWILTAAEYPFYRRALAFITRERSQAELVEAYLNTYREVQAQTKEITDEVIADLRRHLEDDFSVDLPSEADNRRERHPEADNDE